MENSLEHNYIENTEREKLIQLLFSEYGIDVSEYSKASVGRRFSKLFNEFGLKDADDFISLLNHKSEPKDFFFQHFTVNVTEMFRDPEFYIALRERIFPRLEKKERINIWSAACSTGEELVSIAILLKEANLLNKSSLLGTDISPSVLQQAKTGKYRWKETMNYEKVYKHVSKNDSLFDHITKEGSFWHVNQEILNAITYKQHNLLDTPPDGSFDLVVCRNALIYFNKSLQNKVIHNLSEAIPKRGLLALGTKESIIFYQQKERYKEIEREQRIFQKTR